MCRIYTLFSETYVHKGALAWLGSTDSPESTPTVCRRSERWEHRRRVGQ